MNWRNSSIYKVRRRYRGFTLLEIMLAVAILGMMALAIFRFVQTNLTDSMTDAKAKAQIRDTMDKLAISPAAIARAIAFAIEQPSDVDVSEIIIRPTAQT